MVSILKEIISRRSLIRELTLKDLKIRYSRPMLGFFWVFLSPFLMVGVLYLIFSVIFNFRTKEIHFFSYLATALLPWRFFHDSITRSTTSLTDNANFIKESNFPIYLLPVSVVLANALNFIPSLIILLITVIFFLKGLPALIIYLPVIFLMHITATMGLAIAISIFYVKWRDIKYMLEPILLLIFYMTPIFYPLSLVKEKFPPALFKLYICNPFVGIASLYRSVMLKDFYCAVYSQIGPLAFFVIPACFSFMLLFFGFYVYKRNQNRINDHLYY